MAFTFEQGAEVSANQDAQSLFGVGDAVDGGEQARVAGVESLHHGRLEEFLFAAEVVERAAERMPTASAMSRVVVASKPFSTNSRAAARSNSARRLGSSPASAFRLGIGSGPGVAAQPACTGLPEMLVRASHYHSAAATRVP
jgi:hypothetical protein